MPDSITIIDENKVIDVVLIAGRILLESGAETYRVEDTMNRIAVMVFIIHIVLSVQLQLFFH